MENKTWRCPNCGHDWKDELDQPDQPEYIPYDPESGVGEWKCGRCDEAKVLAAEILADGRVPRG